MKDQNIVFALESERLRNIRIHGPPRGRYGRGSAPTATRARPPAYVRTAEGGGARRLRRVAKACRDFGQRVQYSVFEIELDPAQWAALKARLEAIIDRGQDSLRYYYLGADWRRRVEHVGAKPAVDLNRPLIV
jgi:CRISPR-associated protein Cas2